MIIAALFAARAGTVAADPMCADRPGKATPPCTVPAGRLQVETGVIDWSLAKEAGARDTLLVVGETLAKFGLGDRSDFELDVTPWQRVSSRAGGAHQRRSGFGDLVLLYKHRLTRDGSALQAAVLPSVKIPTAKRPLGNRKVEAAMVVPIQYTLGNSPLSVTLGPELDWLADDDGSGHHLASAQAVSIGWQASPRLSLSGELWGQWNWDPAGTVRQASADGAVAYLVGDLVQLDAGANFGLNRETPDVELYAGISKLF